MNKLEITTRIGCKCNCYFCPQDKIIKTYTDERPFFNPTKQLPKLELSYDDFVTMINKVPLHVNIEFSGMAEPWLNKRCTDMLLYAHEKGHKIGVFTTAVGMSIEDIDKLKHVPFTTFRLHVPDRHNFMKVHPDQHYINVLKRIKNAQICNFNVMSMGSIHRALKDIFPNYYKDIMTDRAGNLDVAKSILIASSAYKIGSLTCAWTDTFRNNVLLPDGTILLCCMCYSMEHVLGNLLLQSYESLFSGIEFNSIKLALQNELNGTCLCRTCPASKNI